MTEMIQQLLTGAGSVLDFWPSPVKGIQGPDFMRDSGGQRIGSDWRLVGLHLYRAMNESKSEAAINGTTK